MLRLLSGRTHQVITGVCLLAADAPKLRLGADIRPTRYAADLHRFFETL